MAVNWRNTGATLIDSSQVVNPMSYAYAGVKGETIGETLTGGESQAPSSSVTDVFGKQSKADSEAFQREQTMNQQTKAASIAAELEEQGRPTMEADVDRQREIAQIARRYAQEGMTEAQRQMAASRY